MPRRGLARLFQPIATVLFAAPLRKECPIIQGAFLALLHKRIQFKLLLDETRQTIYSFTQICVATGDVDFICTGEIVQHRRRSSTSIFNCSTSHLE